MIAPGAVRLGYHSSVSSPAASALSQRYSEGKMTVLIYLSPYTINTGGKREQRKGQTEVMEGRREYSETG